MIFKTQIISFTKIILLLFNILLLSEGIISAETETTPVPPYNSGNLSADKMFEEVYYKLNKLELGTTGYVTQDTVAQQIHYETLFFGVSRIVPGTNITITPQNGHGEVTINAAGGDNSYWEIDPVTGGIQPRDTSLATISDDYWELSDGGLAVK